MVWLWHFLYSVGPHPVSSLNINTFVVSRAFMAGAASQTGDADSSRHLVSPLVCRGPWMSTVLLYCLYHSDSALVLSYFTFKPYCELLSKFSAMSFQEYVSTGITYPVFYGDLCLQTKEGQRRSEFHLVGVENSQTSSTSPVWPSDHRENCRSCAWPFYNLVQIIPLWLTKRLGLYDGPCLNLLRGDRVLIPVPSDC